MSEDEFKITEEKKKKLPSFIEDHIIADEEMIVLDGLIGSLFQIKALLKSNPRSAKTAEPFIDELADVADKLVKSLTEKERRE